MLSDYPEYMGIQTQSHVSAVSALPNRIRELRQARGWVMIDLAKKIGISVAHISDLERGKRGLSYEWMVKIARALDCKPADLLTDSHTSEPLSTAEIELLRRFRLSHESQHPLILNILENFTKRSA